MNIKLVIVKVFEFLQVIGKRAVDVTGIIVTKKDLRISELAELALKCQKLQSLSIENCVWIDRLDLGVFSSLKYLSKLVIENRTYKLNDGTFINCTHADDSLVHLPSLKEISFKGTSLNQTKFKTFLAGYTELTIGYLRGESYAGGLKNGLPNGEGKYTSLNGDKKKGHFIEGTFIEGRVKINFPDGSKYEGELKNGKANGTGKFTDLSGDKKTGYFEDGFFLEGRIKTTCVDGSIYEGDVKNGQPHGKGKFTHPDGNEETEEFIDGKFLQGLLKK